MMHYSCDLCQCPLDSENDLRYVVKLEVYAALDPIQVDDDCDNLLEMHEIIERMDESSVEEIGEDVYRQMRFDLCPECRKRFLRNPLGRKLAEHLDFSQN